MYKINGNKNTVIRDYMGYDIVRMDNEYFVTGALVRGAKHTKEDILSPEFSDETSARLWVLDYRSEMVHDLFYKFEIDRREFKREMKRIKNERSRLNPMGVNLDADTLVELTVTLNEVVERIVQEHGISKYDVIDHVNRYLDTISN